MEILIISGLSGAGKSSAATYLEDMGYYTVDNVPADIILKFAEFCAQSDGRYDRVALVSDIRSGNGNFQGILDAMERLKQGGDICRLLFVTADLETIIKRYKETRRRHPFYVPELKHKTGMDSEVYDYVFSFPQTKTFIDKLEGMLSFLLPLYAEEGKSTLVIAVGCTGGHHRSVSVARCIASYLTALGYPAFENHRDITRG